MTTSQTPLDPTELGTILSIWAHPDDETYLSAGIMAAAVANGQRVVCVSATAGELGTNDPVTWPPLRLGRVRYWEASAAMAVIGVDDHRFLGLPDGSLVEHDGSGIALIDEIIDEVRPDTILTFGPDGMTFHPDHIAVHRWVTTAWQRRGCASRLMYATVSVEHLDRFGELYEEWDMYMTDERPNGVHEADLGLHYELDETALDRKLTALRAMATQTSAVISIVDPAVYAQEVAEEAFVEAAPRSPEHPAADHQPSTREPQITHHTKEVTS